MRQKTQVVPASEVRVGDRVLIGYHYREVTAIGVRPASAGPRRDVVTCDVAEYRMPGAGADGEDLVWSALHGVSLSYPDSAVRIVTARG